MKRSQHEEIMGELALLREAMQMLVSAISGYDAPKPKRKRGKAQIISLDKEKARRDR